MDEIKYKMFETKGKKGGVLTGRKVTRVTAQKDGSIKSEIVRTEIKNQKSGQWETRQGGHIVDAEKN